MHNSAPGRFAEAIGADFSIAKEQCIGAQQTKIMQRLHDGHTRGPARFDCGRRQRHPEVVKVRNFRAEPPASRADFLIHLFGPGGTSKKLESVGIIVGFEHLHFDAVRTKHLNFRFDHAIFTTWLPITVVEDKHTHGF